MNEIESNANRRVCSFCFFNGVDQRPIVFHAHITRHPSETCFCKGKKQRRTNKSLAVRHLFLFLSNCVCVADLRVEDCVEPLSKPKRSFLLYVWTSSFRFDNLRSYLDRIRIVWHVHCIYAALLFRSESSSSRSVNFGKKQNLLSSPKRFPEGWRMDNDVDSVPRRF